jgi:hypothetical protein
LIGIIVQKLIELFDCVWDSIEAAGAIEKRPKGPWRHQAGASIRPESPLEQFPVSRYFETSIAAAEQRGLEKVSILIRQAANFLVWSQNAAYSEAKLGVHFMKNYIFGLLTGPGALFARDAPPSGFLLLGPQTEYPAHSHVPREIYLVLTPGAEWRLDGKKWFSVSPGEVIYHASSQIHAMRTQVTPMLAFAAWLDGGSRSAVSI